MWAWMSLQQKSLYRKKILWMSSWSYLLSKNLALFILLCALSIHQCVCGSKLLLTFIITLVDNEYYVVRLLVDCYVCPVGWGWRIHWLHLCRGVRPTPMSVLDMTIKNLMVRLKPWRFGDCGVPFQCHCSQLHSDREW